MGGPRVVIFIVQLVICEVWDQGVCSGGHAIPESEDIIFFSPYWVSWCFISWVYLECRIRGTTLRNFKTSASWRDLFLIIIKWLVFAFPKATCFYQFQSRCQLWAEKNWSGLLQDGRFPACNTVYLAFSLVCSSVFTNGKRMLEQQINMIFPMNIIVPPATVYYVSRYNS